MTAEKAAGAVETAELVKAQAAADGLLHKLCYLLRCGSGIQLPVKLQQVPVKVDAVRVDQLRFLDGGVFEVPPVDFWVLFFFGKFFFGGFALPEKFPET